MTKRIKQQQQWLLTLIIGLISLIIIVLAWWGNHQKAPKIENKPAVNHYPLASALSSHATEAHWVEKIQQAWRAEAVNSKVRDNKLHALQADKEKQQAMMEAQQTLLGELNAKIMQLEAQTHQLTQQYNQATKEGRPNQALSSAPNALENNTGEALGSSFMHYTAHLQKKTKSRVKTPANYVFSNTFAKAVVLQGADASAGVSSQTNPDVMLLQIIADGVMPNRHRSPLNGCFVSASVIGDISSERGKLRTERISCIHPDGTSLDTQVTGIVADAKNGIRGRAVWRDEPMLKKVFWGSFWESIGHIGQHTATDYQNSPVDKTLVAPAHIPLAAFSSGGAGAASKYAEYNIKRAELYHPVIQLSPGTIVDITFLKGFWLDGGTDNQAGESALTVEPANDSMLPVAESAEAKAAHQFFYQNHTF